MCIELSEKKQEAILEDLKQATKKKRGLKFKKMKVGGEVTARINRHPSREVFSWPHEPTHCSQTNSDVLGKGASSVAGHERLGPAHKRSGKGANPRQRAGGGGRSLQRNAGCPAKEQGAGGVWLPGNKPPAPVVWRLQWPQEIKDARLTWENPKGTITNSDLEMAAELLG